MLTMILIAIVLTCNVAYQVVLRMDNRAWADWQCRVERARTSVVRTTWE